MKKLLNGLLSVIVIASTASESIACKDQDNDDKKVLASEMDNNYQPGIKSNIDNYKTTNKIHGYFGDAMHNYSAYNVNKSVIKNNEWQADNDWKFNGNYLDQFNVSRSTYTLQSWKNETSYAQLILANKDNEVNNLKVDVESAQKSNIEIKTNFLDFVYNSTINKDKNVAWYTPDVNLSQRLPDKIGGSMLPVLKAKMVQPVWITVHVPKDESSGMKNFKLNVYGDNSIINSYTLKVDVNKNVLEDDNSNTKSSNSFFTGAANSVFTSESYYGKTENRLINVDSKKPNGMMMNAPTVVSGLKFMSDDHKKYLSKELQSLRRMGQNFVAGYVDQYYWPEANNLYKDGYESGLVRWIQNDDNIDPSKPSSWTFDFTPFDQYFEYAQSLGFQYFLAQHFAVSFTNSDDQGNPYHSLSHQTKAGGDKKLISDKLYYHSVRGRDALTKFLEAFRNHLIEKHWEQKVMISFDETPDDALQYYKGILNDVDHISDAKAKHVFKQQIFAGWRWKMKWNDPAFVDAMNGKTWNINSFDEIDYGGYMILSHMFNKKSGYESDLSLDEIFDEMTKIADNRRENGYTTGLYNTRSSYPSTLVTNDFGDDMWGPLFSKKMHFDNYQKWMFNAWKTMTGKSEKSQYSNPEEWSLGSLDQPDGSYVAPTGDSFLIYPTKSDTGEICSSVRFELMNYANEAANKIQQIINMGGDEAKSVNLALANLSWPMNPAIDGKAQQPIYFDLYYKYNDLNSRKLSNKKVTDREVIDLMNAISQI